MIILLKSKSDLYEKYYAYPYNGNPSHNADSTKHQ